MCCKSFCFNCIITICLCLSVCLVVTTASREKRLNRSRYSVGRVYLGGPKEPCVKWWPGSPTEMALGGQNPPPHIWHFLCWIYLDMLGGSGPPRKWHFLCWIYLDVLGGQDLPWEGHFLWGYTWTCLGLPAVDVLSVTRKGQQRCGLSLPILQPLVSVFGDRHFSVFFPAVIAPPRKHCKVVCVRCIISETVGSVV